MKISFFDLLAPHYCCSCGEIGSVLCEYCKYDIISHSYDRCIECLVPISGDNNICKHCKSPYRQAWACGERNETLEKLINLYKFDHTYAASGPLCDLLDSKLPVVDNLIIVPIPTISSHIRQRGRDHIAVLAKGLARRRRLPYRPVLYRKTNTVQHEASKRVRLEQAERAFGARTLSGERCLLIDDIYTTGATLRAAARQLLAAGASEVWVLVLARQPLEK